MKKPWVVRIKVPYFMCGIHRFATRKAALKFKADYEAVGLKLRDGSADAITGPTHEGRRVALERR